MGHRERSQMARMVGLRGKLIVKLIDVGRRFAGAQIFLKDDLQDGI